MQHFSTFHCEMSHNMDEKLQLNENFEKKRKSLYNMGEKYSFASRTMVPQEIGPIFPKEPWFFK